MRFRNAFRMVLNNFRNVYKLLLFRLITNALVFSLMYAVVTLGLHVIFSSEEMGRCLSMIGEFFTSLTTGKIEFLESFRTEFAGSVTDLLVLLGTNIGSIVGSVVGVALLYLVGRFLNGTALFAVASTLNDKMATYGNTRFSAAYFKDLAKATLFQVIYVPLAFVYDLAGLVLCWFFFFFTPSFLPSWGIVSVIVGLSLSLAAFLCLQALKLTFTSAWMPAVIADGKSVGGAFSESFRSMKGFAGRFSNYLIGVYLILIVNVLCGACTLGSAILLTVPASYMFLLALQFVHYYEDTGKKYFLSYRKISGADGKPEGMGN